MPHHRRRACPGGRSRKPNTSAKCDMISPATPAASVQSAVPSYRVKRNHRLSEFLSAARYQRMGIYGRPSCVELHAMSSFR